MPGPVGGPAWGFGQGRCLDEAAPCTALSGMADEACGQDRGFAGVTDDELLALARDLTAAAARHPASTWCLTITGPDGRPVAQGCGRPPSRAEPGS